MPQHKGGKKNRKHGRDSKQCQAYRGRNQRELNKTKRQAKHLARHPNDKSGQ